MEIPEVFGTYELENTLGPRTPDQIALSARMQNIWASLARDPALGPGWPKVGSTLFGNELGVLGGTNNPSGESTENLMHSDYACALYAPLLLALNRAF